MAAQTPSRALNRLRKAGRIFGYVLGALVGLVVLTVVTVFLVGRSDWGRKKILALVIPAVNGVLTGTLKVGALDGDLTHMLVLRDIELDDPEGRPAVRVRSVGLRYNLLALVGRTLHITAVHLEGGQVDARFLRDGRLNLAALVKPSDTPPSDHLPLRIVVSGVEADVALAATLSGPGAPAIKGPSGALITRADAQLHLSAEVDVQKDKSLRGELTGLKLVVTEPLNLDLSLKAAARVQPGKRAMPSVITVEDLLLLLRTRGREINRMLPAAQITADGEIGIDVKVRGTLEKLLAQIDLGLPAGRGTIEATVNAVEPTLPWTLAVRMHGLEPQKLRADLPPARIDLEMSGKGEGPSGRVNLTGLGVALGPNRVKLSGFVDAPKAPPAWQDPLALKGELLIDVGAHDLKALTAVPVLVKAGAPPLSGALLGSIQLTLAERTLRTHANLNGVGLRGFDASLGKLHLEADTVNLGGRVALSLTDLSIAGQRFAHVGLGLGGGPQRLTLELKGEGPQETRFRLAVAAKPVSRPGLGLGGQTLTGLVAEVTELSLSRRAATLALETPLVARAVGLDSKLPVFDVEKFRLSLAGTPVTLAGHYEAGPKKMSGLVDIADLDVHKLGKVVLNRSDLPKTRIDLHAQVAGTVAAPSGSVKLQADVGEMDPVLPWPTTHALEASLRGRRVRGTLSSRSTVAKAGGPLGPALKLKFDAPLKPSGPVDVELDADARFAALSALLPPVLKKLGGDVSVQVAVKGSFEAPEATVRVRVPSWELEPLRGNDTLLNVDYVGQKLTVDVESKVLRHKTAKDGPKGTPLGTLKLAAAVPLRLSVKTRGPELMQQLRSAASTARIELRELMLPQILRTAGVGLDETAEPIVRSGTAEILVDAHGPLMAPGLNVSLNSHGVALAAFKDVQPIEVGAGLNVGFTQNKVTLTARIDKDVQPILSVRADTDLVLAEALDKPEGLIERLPLRAAVDLNLDPKKLPAGIPIQGLLEAHVKATGTVKQPEVKATLKGTDLVVTGWPVGNVDVSGSFDPSRMVRVHASVVQAQGAGADKVAGRAAGSLLLDAQVPLPFDLTSGATTAALKANGFRLDYKAPLDAGGLRYVRGTLNADLKVQGAKQQPVVEGMLRLRDGEISLRALAQPVDKIQVDADFNRSGLFTLRQVSAHSGGGQLHASGKVKLDEGTLRTVELTANADRFPLAAGPLALWLDTKVEVRGEAKGETLRIKTRIPGGTVHLPRLTESRSVQAIGPLDDVVFVDAAAVRAAQAKARAEEEKEQKEREGRGGPPILLPTRTLLAVDVNNFYVTGPEVKTGVVGHIDLELGEKSKLPVITGEVHTTGGTVEVLGRRYQIERGQVSLSGSVPPNPLLNVQISRKVDEAVIYVVVSGSAKKPAITFRSDPPMDQGQVIAIVLSGSKSGGRIQQQALGALSGLLVGQLKDQLGGAVPVDVIKFDVSGSDPTGANQSSVEVGKYLRDDLYLSYTHRFGNPSTILKRLNENQAAIEWTFLQSYQLYLMGGDQGVGALNLYWSKRF
ncbi:MAG: translocation/assembly module TamB domain-containing protein [Polyangia bacterium]